MRNFTVPGLLVVTALAVSLSCTEADQPTEPSASEISTPSFGQAGGGKLSGFEVVQVQNQVASSNLLHTLIVSCPTGKVALGGGWAVGGNATIVVSAPLLSEKGSWIFKFARTTGEGFVSVSGFVTCAAVSGKQ